MAQPKKVIIQYENGQVLELPGRYANRIFEKTRKCVSVFVGKKGDEMITNLAQKFVNGRKSDLLKPLVEWYFKHYNELMEDKIKFHPNEIPKILDEYITIQEKLEAIIREKEILEQTIRNLRSRIYELENEVKKLEDENEQLKIRFKEFENRIKEFTNVQEHKLEYIDPVLGMIKIVIKSSKYILDIIINKLKRMNYGEVIRVLDVLRDLGLIEYRVVRG